VTRPARSSIRSRVVTALNAKRFDLHQAPYARGYFVGDYQGLDSQGSAFRTLFTLATPGSDTVFPNPNSTDEFTNSAF
jgi:hypothetical protein